VIGKGASAPLYKNVRDDVPLTIIDRDHSERIIAILLQMDLISKRNMAFLLRAISTDGKSSSWNMGGLMAMKRTVLILVGVLILCDGAMGATLNLRAAWTANTESDMKEYRLYRTDGGRSLIGVVSHPIASYGFSATVPGHNAGNMTFVVTAVDRENNESPDSNVSIPDAAPPAPPKNVKKR
jgi:hypothetical protein